MPCQEETEQALPGRDQGQDVAWDGGGAEVAWAARLLPVPAVIAFVPLVDTERRTSLASRATKEAARRAAAL